jgi:hypothetical protein
MAGGRIISHAKTSAVTITGERSGIQILIAVKSRAHAWHQGQTARPL